MANNKNKDKKKNIQKPVDVKQDITPKAVELEAPVIEEPKPVEEDPKVIEEPEKVVEPVVVKEEVKVANEEPKADNGIKTYKHYYTYVWNGMCFD